MLLGLHRKLSRENSGWEHQCVAQRPLDIWCKSWHRHPSYPGNYLTRRNVKHASCWVDSVLPHSNAILDNVIQAAFVRLTIERSCLIKKTVDFSHASIRFKPFLKPLLEVGNTRCI